MRRIVAGFFQSLDGVVQAPGGPQEDESSGFAFGKFFAHPFSSYCQRLRARPSFARCVDDARPCRPLFPLGAPDRD